LRLEKPVLPSRQEKKAKSEEAIKHGRVFTSLAKDCKRCYLRSLCLIGGRVNKAVVLGDDYPALLRRQAGK
jgi:hypothetical protein